MNTHVAPSDNGTKLMRAGIVSAVVTTPRRAAGLSTTIFPSFLRDAAKNFQRENENGPFKIGEFDRKLFINQPAFYRRLIINPFR